MKKLFIILTAVLGSTAVHGQTALLCGTIKDSTINGCVEQAKLHFIKNDTTIFSNDFGFFKIKLNKSLADTLVVSHRTLGTKTIPLSLSDKEINEIVVHLPKSCKDLPDTDICPICNSNKDVVPIEYGLPTPQTRKKADKEVIVLGGCIVGDCSPKHYCKKDKLRF